MKRITIILMVAFFLIGLSNNKEYENKYYNESIETVKQEEQPITISKDKAIYLVKEMFKKDGYIPSIIEVNHIEGNNYVVHVYEIIKDDETTSHTATIGWYYVDIYSGKIESIF